MKSLLLIAVGAFIVLRVLREFLSTLLIGWGMLEEVDERIREQSVIPDSPMVERTRFFRRWWFGILWIFVTVTGWIGWLIFGR